MTPAGRPAAARPRLRDGLVRGVVAEGAATWLRRGPDGGTPIVVLHGAGLDRAGASWCRVLPGLAESRQILAPDLPGHGGTAPLRTFDGIDDQVRWLLAFLDAVEVRRAAIAGVSMGGAIALRMALVAPERVAAVVPVACYGLARRSPLHRLLHIGTRLPLARLTDPMIARSDAAARAALRAIVHDPGAITSTMVGELRAIAEETHAERTFDRFLGVEIRPTGFRTFLLDDLRRLRVPALFIHGRHDTAVPIRAARRAARIAGASLVEVAAGHWPMYEAPEACLEAMRGFLDGHPA